MSDIYKNCCTGFKYTGTAKGSIVNFHGVESYIVGSKASKKAIIIFSDIYGHTYINTQLTADQFAERGFFVVVPDLFKGDPVGSAEFDSWKEKHPMSESFDAGELALKGILAEIKPESIGAVGYCWGGKLAVAFLDMGKVKASAIAHPSFLELKEISLIKGPLTIAAAEVDTLFTAELRHEAEKILAETGQHYSIALYGGTTHGFAVRGDPDNFSESYARQQAFEQFSCWFKIHL